MSAGLAVVLASGGIDSSVCLALARRRGPVLALGVDYHQRNRIELDRLQRIAAALGCDSLIVSLDMRPWCPPGLVDSGVPEAAVSEARNYVPGRNLAFLGIAASVAEGRGADRIYLGAGASDLCHPDCTSVFLESFRETLAAGVHKAPALRTPLIGLNKSQIVLAGVELGVPLNLTWSCHASGPLPCARCVPCRLRRETFTDLGVPDPAV